MLSQSQGTIPRGSQGTESWENSRTMNHHPRYWNILLLILSWSQMFKGKKTETQPMKRRGGCAGQRRQGTTHTPCSLHRQSCEQKTDANFTLYLFRMTIWTLTAAITVLSVLQNSQSWINWTYQCPAISLEETHSYCPPTVLAHPAPETGTSLVLFSCMISPIASYNLYSLLRVLYVMDMK